MVEESALRVSLDFELFSEAQDETLELSLEGGLSLTLKGFSFSPDETCLDPIDIKQKELTVFAVQKGQLIYVQCLNSDSKFQQILAEMGLSSEEYTALQQQDAIEITFTINSSDKSNITQISSHFDHLKSLQSSGKSQTFEDAVQLLDAMPGSSGWITAETPLDQIEDFEIPKHIKVIGLDGEEEN